MEIADHLAALETAGGRLADAADRAGPAAAVRYCPGWTMRDLVAHTGGVQRWATSIVSTGRPDAPTPEEEREFFAAPSDGLTDWFRAGNAALLAALRAADPGLTCWTFLRARSPLHFWARRQAHEATIHSIDAGAPDDLEPRFAVDGVDELLTGFFARRRRRHADDPPLTIGLRAIDTGDRWTARIRAGFCELVDDEAPPVVVAGPAVGLYRLLWNRLDPDELDVTGDRAVLDGWRARMKITWA